MKKLVSVQISEEGSPIRIYRNIQYDPSTVLWPKALAIKSIREQVYVRAKGECEKCGKLVTWKQAHMDEKVSKGEGGEVSLANCWILCYNCHEGSSDSEHGERRWGGKHGS